MLFGCKWKEKGQGLVEYALVLAMVVVLAMALVHNDALRQAIADLFATVAGAFGEESL